jgi:hypothetical protein
MIYQMLPDTAPSLKHTQPQLATLGIRDVLQPEKCNHAHMMHEKRQQGQDEKRVEDKGNFPKW